VPGSAFPNTMTSLQFLLFALTLNILRFRNEQASLCYFYFVFIIVIKKITDPQIYSSFFAHPVYIPLYATYKGLAQVKHLMSRSDGCITLTPEMCRNFLMKGRMMFNLGTHAEHGAP